MRKQILKYIIGIGIMAFSGAPMSADTVAGSASIVLAEEEEPKGSVGNPYTVADILPLDGKANVMTEKWFEGYIVGYVSGNVYSEGATIGLPDDPDCITNIIIAGSKDETDVDKCIPVNLPYGDLRNALNLYANPENLGKRLKLYGNFELYYSRGGIRKPKEFEWLADELQAPDYTMYVIGSNVNGMVWSVGEESAQMTYTAEGVWEWDGDLLGAEFKFNDGSWDGNYNIGSATDQELVLGIPYSVANSNMSTNIILSKNIEEVLNPHVVLDLNTMTVTVTGGANRVKPVKLTVTIDGYSTFSYDVAKNEETTVSLDFADENWAIDEVTVNGEVLDQADAGNSTEVSFIVEEASEITIKAVYTGEIEFVVNNQEDPNNSVKTLYDNVRIGVEEETLIIEGLESGEHVDVYNMGGRREASVTAGAQRLEIQLVKGQAYVVRIGTHAVKVIL